MKWSSIICFVIMFSLMAQTLSPVYAADPPATSGEVGDDTAPTVVSVDDCCDDLDVCIDNLTSCMNNLSILEGDIEYLNRTLSEKENTIQDQRNSVYQLEDLMTIKINIFNKNVIIINLILNLVFSLGFSLELRNILKLKIRDKKLEEYTVKQLLRIEKIKQLTEFVNSLKGLGHAVVLLIQTIVAFLAIFSIIFQFI